MIFRRMPYFFVLFSFFLLVNLSCEKITGKPPLSKEKFSLVYTDYILAVDQKETEFVGAVVDSVFKYHEVQTNDFKKTLQFYVKNPEQLEEIMNLVSKELEKRSHEIESAKMREQQATQKQIDPAGAKPILE
ncbi:DUF4296 domain-containing protein [candidate division KSB1 bacterium]|nr:DUF4296 domain-containing protein [candidate division KSB1 bacterium]